MQSLVLHMEIVRGPKLKLKQSGEGVLEVASPCDDHRSRSSWQTYYCYQHQHYPHHHNNENKSNPATTSNAANTAATAQMTGTPELLNPRQYIIEHQRFL